jgi:hypothetical protein
MSSEEAPYIYTSISLLSIKSSIHSFNKYLLNVGFVPGIILVNRDVLVKKKKEV